MFVHEREDEGEKEDKQADVLRRGIKALPLQIPYLPSTEKQSLLVIICYFLDLLHTLCPTEGNYCLLPHGSLFALLMLSYIRQSILSCIRQTILRDLKVSNHRNRKEIVLEPVKQTSKLRGIL